MQTKNPADLAADAARLGDLNTAVRAEIRNYGQGKSDGSGLAPARAALDAACEEFRRKHFPRAPKVFVVCDHAIGQRLNVYRRTPSGRAVEVF